MSNDIYNNNSFLIHPLYRMSINKGTMNRINEIGHAFIQNCHSVYILYNELANMSFAHL